MQPVSSYDPRYGDTAREVLFHILQDLTLPPNYRVTFGLDPHSEKLVLRVMMRPVTEMRLFGVTWQRFRHSWEELRRLEGRSYNSIVCRLAEAPEFLEFETIVETPTRS